MSFCDTLNICPINEVNRQMALAHKHGQKVIWKIINNNHISTDLESVWVN